MKGVGEARETELRVSVVVPSWKDSENLAILLPSLAGMPFVDETIVVDASGDQQAEELARAFGAMFLQCPRPNRGAQMNAGANRATGDVLVFQHADTQLTEAHLCALAEALRDPDVIGGAFHREFDERHPRLKWLGGVARALARNGGTLFGDQSIFVRREIFHRLNGFALIPLMEDMEFSRRLRAAGTTVVLDPPVRSSARRHARQGAWRTSIQNGLFILLYKVGVSPVLLHRWYYRDSEDEPVVDALSS